MGQPLRPQLFAKVLNRNRRSRRLWECEPYAPLNNNKKNHHRYGDDYLIDPCFKIGWGHRSAILPQILLLKQAVGFYLCNKEEVDDFEYTRGVNKQNDHKPPRLMLF